MNIENNRLALAFWGVSAGALVAYFFASLVFETVQHKSFDNASAPSNVQTLLWVALGASAFALFFNVDKRFGWDGINPGSAHIDDIWDLLLFAGSATATLAVIEIVSWFL